MTKNIQEELKLNDLNSPEKIKRKVGRPNTTGLAAISKETATDDHNQY